MISISPVTDFVFRKIYHVSIITITGTLGYRPIVIINVRTRMERLAVDFTQGIIYWVFMKQYKGKLAA